MITDAFLSIPLKRMQIPIYILSILVVEEINLSWLVSTLCLIIKIHTRTKQFLLPPLVPAVQCSGGQVYQECGRACGSSCSDLQQGWSCDDDGGSGPRMCVPGCQCPPGLLQDQQNQCVPAAMCPCVQEGKVYQPGALIQNSCNTWYATWNILWYEKLLLGLLGNHL